MCEPLLPIDELKSLKWSVTSLALAYERGTVERELVINAAKGINRRLDWVIANLEMAKEGQKNFGIEKY